MIINYWFMTKLLTSTCDKLHSPKKKKKKEMLLSENLFHYWIFRARLPLLAIDGKGKSRFWQQLN